MKALTAKIGGSRPRGGAVVALHLACSIVAGAGPIPSAVAADAAATEVTAEADAPAPAVPRIARLESWTGADATRHAIGIWSGLTWAPFGGIQEDGWRLRVVSGAGRYTYDGWRIVGGIPAPAHFLGATTFLDAMAGYHLQLGTLTLKPFAGVSIAQHGVTPFDPVSQLIGRTVGVKLALDTWLQLGEAAYLNVDGAW